MTVLLVTLAAASAARAQSSFTERSIPPSATTARQPESAAPQVTAPQLPALERQPAAGASAGQSRATSSPGYFPYTVSPGDTLGKLAQSFGVPLDALVHANRMRPDDELFVGEKLKIPNPFESERRNLQGEIAALATDNRETHRKLNGARVEILSLKERNESLTGENANLGHEVKILPWWRAAALGGGAAALLMLGVTVLALFERWILRRRFAALADLAEALGHLDVKYKESLAKAELRMQQLYGRRRPGMPAETAEHSPKTPEEIEIERLNRQLKMVLQDYLERMGVRSRGGKRRARWREIVGETEESAAEARGVRR